jgi:hypothetical protein
MVALRLVRLVESHSEELARGIAREIHTSARTSELRRIPLNEVEERIGEILRHLSEWLLTKTAGEVEQHYLELGARRAMQGVSVADVSWAIILTKERLWEFLQRQGFLHSPVELYGEMELLWLLTQFFDKALCAAIEGYEKQVHWAAEDRLPLHSRHARGSAASAD